MNQIISRERIKKLTPVKEFEVGKYYFYIWSLDHKPDNPTFSYSIDVIVQVVERRSRSYKFWFSFDLTKGKMVSRSVKTNCFELEDL